jgi:hypothetical protein
MMKIYDINNDGWATCMKWCWTAVMLFFCCISETAFAVIFVFHGLLFAFFFLNRDISQYTAEAQKVSKSIRNEAVQRNIDYEIEKNKEPLMAQFIVYRIENKDISEQENQHTQPAVSRKVEENWQSIMQESIENEAIVFDLDVNLSKLSSVAPKRASRVEFEVS